MDTKVILDTYIGYDPDDLFALLYLLKSGITPACIITGDECYGNKRAGFLKTVLRKLGRETIPVVAGTCTGSIDFVVDAMIDPVCSAGETDYVEYIGEMLRETPEHCKVTYICIQSAGNLARVLHLPGAVERLDVYLMGGAVNYTRPGREDWVEHNLKIDPEAFATVLQSPVATHIVMAETTHNPVYEVPYDGSLMEKLIRKGGTEAELLWEHFRLWIEAKRNNRITSSYMHDPLTVSVALRESFVDFNHSALRINKAGKVIVTCDGPKKFWSKQKSRAQEFMAHFEEVLLS